MLRFDDPQYLWLLCIIPILLLVRVWAYTVRRKNLRRLGDPALIAQLAPGVSAMRRNVKFALVIVAIAFIIIAVARPQMGSKISKEQRKGIEAVICLDISRSMLAEDVVPSRLDKSKMLVESLIDNFTSDKVGLVVFAGDAFIQLPITNDYVSAKMFLQNATPALIHTQGTDIGRAVNLAMHSFTQDEKVGKAVIVITDGEDHEAGALEAAKAAQNKGVNVFILGVGTTKGAPIPDGNGGYLKDNTGNTVITALNEQMCQAVAKMGQGTYIHVDNTSQAQEQLNAALGRLQRGNSESVVYSAYDEQFQAFALIALLLLALDAIMGEAGSKVMEKLMHIKSKITTAQ